MLKVIFGNKTAERVLLYLANYGDGYGQEISRTYGAPVSQVQKQLTKFEDGGVLVSHSVGKTRLYQLNPRWYFNKELVELLQKALWAMPDEDTLKYYRKRKRPRRTSKPL